MNRYLTIFMVLAVVGLCSCTNGQTRVMVLTTPGSSGGNGTGDIESVIAGTGLVGGGTSGSVTLNVSALVCVGTNVSQYNGTSFVCTVPSGSGTPGSNGTGIRDIYVLSNGSLQVNLTNGTNITSGNLTGAQGAQGIQGIQGDTGATGPAGTNATANWTLANSVNVSVIGQSYTLNFTNGAGINVGLYCSGTSCNVSFASTITQYTDALAAAAVQNTTILRNGTNSNWVVLNATTINFGGTNATICWANGTNCPASSASNAGWLNTTTQVYLANNNTNISVGSNLHGGPFFFVDNTNNKLSVGVPPANTSQFIEFATSESAKRGMAIAYYFDDTQAGNLNIRKARGNLSNPSNVLAGDTVGGFGMQGYGDGAFRNGGFIRVIAQENFNGTQSGSYLRFDTTSLGTTTMTEKMRISPSGDVAINTTTPTQTLNVLGTANVTGIMYVGGHRQYPIQNVTYMPLFRDILYAAGPAGVAITSMNSTARCTSFPVNTNTQVVFDNVNVMVDNTNASIGVYVAIYTCTSIANTFDCTSGDLLYNFTRFSLGTSAMTGVTNNTGNWTLPAGNYVSCRSTNVTNAQSGVLRGSTGSAGAGSTLRLTVTNGAFPQSATFTTSEADAVPYVYAYSRNGVRT